MNNTWIIVLVVVLVIVIAIALYFKFGTTGSGNEDPYFPPPPPPPSGLTHAQKVTRVQSLIDNACKILKAAGQTTDDIFKRQGMLTTAIAALGYGLTEFSISEFKFCP